MNFDAGVERDRRPAVILSANTAWFITNFCTGLIEGIRTAGYDPVVIAPAEPAAEPAIRKLGVEHFAVQIERSGINPISDLRLLGQYRRLLSQVKPAAYLGYTIKPNIYGSMAAASLGIPAVPNVSGLGTAFIRSGPLRTIVTWLYRRAFRKAAVVFFQNAEDRQLFVDQEIVGTNQAQLLPGLGIDLDQFTPASPTEGAPTFLLVARLLKDKGVVEFVDAARSLRHALPNARFQLLGPVDEANLTAVTRAEIGRWEAEGVVDYLGSTDDVRPFLAGASAIVLPSYREGLPRSLLEAAAMARPLIATDVPGCREVVEDGVNGFLCAVRNSASLASAMRRMAELRPEERIAMGKAARRKVQERFSEEFVVRSYLDVLAGLDAAQSAT